MVETNPSSAGQRYSRDLRRFFLPGIRLPWRREWSIGTKIERESQEVGWRWDVLNAVIVHQYGIRFEPRKLSKRNAYST